MKRHMKRNNTFTTCLTSGPLYPCKRAAAMVMPAGSAEKRFSQVKAASAPRYAVGMKIIVRWALLAAALLLVAYLYPGVKVAGFGADSYRTALEALLRRLNP